MGWLSPVRSRDRLEGRHDTLAGMPDEPHILHADGSRSEGRVEQAGERELDLTPGDVTFIRIDHLTRLQVGGVEVVIESPFTLRAGGREYALDPRERGALGPLLALYPDTLNAASTGSDGTLHLTLGSGATITVPPNPLYEPWQIVGPGSAMIVCMPGTEGRLVIWT
jgi:hypothetical protein